MSESKRNIFAGKYFLLDASVLLLVLTVLSLAVIYIGGILYPLYLPWVPVFYYLYSLLFYYFTKKYDGRRMPVYLITLLRFVRFIGSLVVLIVGVISDSGHAVQYTIIFVIFYIVYLIFETKMMTVIEKENGLNETEK